MAYFTALQTASKTRKLLIIKGSKKNLSEVSTLQTQVI